MTKKELSINFQASFTGLEGSNVAMRYYITSDERIQCIRLQIYSIKEKMIGNLKFTKENKAYQLVNDNDLICNEPFASEVVQMIRQHLIVKHPSLSF